MSGILRRLASRTKQEPITITDEGRIGVVRAARNRCGVPVTLPTLGRSDRNEEPVHVPSATRHSATGPPPAIDAAELRAAIRRAARAVDRHAATLTRLDSVLGDGDHGDNLSTGFRAVLELLDELPADTPPGELLRAVGHRLVATVGGASGPLYGTACIEAGFHAGDVAALEPELIAGMLSAAAAGLARRGRCSVGDKTILDTLQPAADAARTAIDNGAGPAEAQRAAIEAARRGMRSTAAMVARRGLALRLGDRSIGHRDPGAVSCLILLLALAER
jgi:phosphoenolpyruvate---glycerone phosphotransferase subunit DhaL